MTTNLIAEIAITLVAVTNWTGVNFQDKELGYVATNHIATITYENEKKVFPLKSVESNIAVWRPYQAITISSDSLTITNNLTNIFWWVKP